MSPAGNTCLIALATSLILSEPIKLAPARRVPMTSGVMGYCLRTDGRGRLNEPNKLIADRVTAARCAR